MSQTLKVDMATQVEAWKIGVGDGETYVAEHGQGLEKSGLNAHADSVCSETDAQKREDWKAGYCRGFREGVRRGLQQMPGS